MAIASPRLLAMLPAIAILTTACGGPSVPSRHPASSPLSPRAESAPLPVLGSSFEDAPLAEADERAADGGAGPADAGAAGADGGVPAVPAPEHHGGHGHAH